ncbi:MAG: efflux RND transporter periplasmic adaptor subunit, partial [Candidatus Rokuibacteriota bacterium]
MSQRSVEQALGKMITDESFRRDFFRDPERTSLASGLELSSAEVEALRRAPRVMLAKLGASLEDCICRLAVPGEPGQGETRAMKTRTFSRERSWLAAALMLLAAWPLAGCTNSEADSRTPAAPKPLALAIEAVPAEARALPRALEVTGTLNADAETDVAAELAARVIRVNAERGQVVEPGAVLAALDQQDALNQLAEAEAVEAQIVAKLGLVAGEPFDALATPEVRQARVTLERMELEYQRYERLAKQDLVSRSDHDLKRTDYLAQKEQYNAKVNEARQVYQTLQAQRARVAMARKTVTDTAIRAPYAGLVVERHVHVGQYVQRGTKIATLVRVDPLRIELAVPESAVTSVKRGQKVAFWVQTYPGRAFEGTIAYVGPALKAESRALVVEALVPNGAHELQPGLFATARIQLPAAAPTPFVPVSAVRTEAGVSQVFVIKGDRAEQRFVQLGREVDGQYEIVRGLQVGERVAVRPPAGLADG